jgi:UDP-N-acetyl-D-glucosamine/UDP-N-acetyl-D-galactosamine dehydrogenase
MLKDDSSLKVAIIGLGYVGLPLAIEFSKKRTVLGFDINQARVKELNKFYDATLEVSSQELRESKNLIFSDEKRILQDYNCYIVCVPTPIDAYKNPNLSSLISATNLVASCIKKGDLIIYESTVFPGATEEVCVPILEDVSGLVYNEGFSVGYSPERVNPGDRVHKIPNIVKITSGSTLQTANVVDRLYNEIIEVGTYRAPSIRVAEAAKCIENVQRDINIALMNELSILFNKLDVDFKEVLRAASTKWNFLPFEPGLVGGHCIGVDPYYLTHKAASVGYHPEIILAGRNINDSMSFYVVEMLTKKMLSRGINLEKSKVGILGITFKENCPDVRNSKVLDVIKHLKNHNIEVIVHDNHADNQAMKAQYDISLSEIEEFNDLDALLIAVNHREFLKIDTEILKKMYCSKSSYIIGDIKSLFDKKILINAGFDVFSL